MEELSQHQSGAPVFGQVQPQRRCGLLCQNESQVSIREGVGWLWRQQLGPWLSLTTLTQTFCCGHIKCCPLLRGENEGWVSYRVPWGALWSVTWRGVGVGSGTDNILYTFTVCISQSIHWSSLLGKTWNLPWMICRDTPQAHVCFLCVCLLIWKCLLLNQPPLKQPLSTAHIHYMRQSHFSYSQVTWD